MNGGTTYQDLEEWKRKAALYDKQRIGGKTMTKDLTTLDELLRQIAEYLPQVHVHGTSATVAVSEVEHLKRLAGEALGMMEGIGKDTERTDWLERQMSSQRGNRWPTFDPPSMDPMCDWKWFSGDEGPFESMREAIDAAMNGEPR